LKTVAYVPMKMTNERLPGKNTALLGGRTPLYHLILGSLLATKSIDEIYVFCSDESIPDLPDGVRYLRRHPSLDQSTTKINEVMNAFAQDVEADVYVLAHATAPFLSSESLERLVQEVRGAEHDSACTVTALQEFMWKDGQPFNYEPSAIPRTQDLDPYFVETSGAYAYRRELVQAGRRVGFRPALITVPKIEAIDINNPEDWFIADAVYQAQTRSTQDTSK